jgi:N-acyl-L-homoserine lactone synthetase
VNAEVRPRHFWDHAGGRGSFFKRVAELLTRVDCRRVDTSEQREAISRLRYQAYLREGAVAANTLARLSDHYDETANAYLFALYVDGELASSLRLHVGSKRCPDFPSLEVFPGYLRPELESGKVLLDTTRFVTDEGLSRLYRDLPYVTLRLFVLAAEYFGADQCLAAVAAEHQPFYQRAFNHQEICEPRPEPQLLRPIGLMALHFPSAANELHRRYPFFRSSLFERRGLFER